MFHSNSLRIFDTFSAHCLSALRSGRQLLEFLLACSALVYKEVGGRRELGRE